MIRAGGDAGIMIRAGVADQKEGLRIPSSTHLKSVYGVGGPTVAQWLMRSAEAMKEAAQVSVRPYPCRWEEWNALGFKGAPGQANIWSRRMG